MLRARPCRLPHEGSCLCPSAFAVPHPPLIIPGVADDEREQISDTVAAYEEVGRRIARIRPETIVISSPHAEMYLDYLHISGGVGASGNYARFGAPHARYSATYDQRFVRELCNEAEAEGIAAGTAGERSPELDHGTMIPWHFVREGWRHATQEGELPVNTPLPLLVRMGISGLSPLEHYRLGQAMQRVAERLGRRVVYIASSDHSHRLKEDGPYGLTPEGTEFDASTCDAFKTGSFFELLTMEQGFCERAAECGLRSFQLMAGALDRTTVTSELISYESPFGVGYGVAAFTRTGTAGSAPERNFGEQYVQHHAADMCERREAEDPWVELARRTLEAYVGDAAFCCPTSTT